MNQPCQDHLSVQTIQVAVVHIHLYTYTRLTKLYQESVQVEKMIFTF